MSDSDRPTFATSDGSVPIDYAPQRPTSVTVIAIIGIVFAAFMLIVCLPLSIVPYFIPAVVEKSPPLVQIKSNTPLFAWLIGTVLFGVAMNLLLLFASIGSLRVRKWARSAMLTYAILFILSTFPNMYVQFRYVVPITTAPENLPPEARSSAQFAQTANYVGGSCMAVVFMLHPLAILIFFTRRHVVDAFERRITL